MNIGILNSGGDCPGLNAVTKAVVLAAKNKGQHKVYGFQNGFEGMYTENGYRELILEDVETIERMGGTILGTKNKGDFGEIGAQQEPSAQAKSLLNKIVATKEKLNLEALIVTGGDGSLRIAYWIGQQTGINIIGIPKTIDNDLANTDVTLGFRTAVQTACNAISQIRDTAQALQRVLVVEVMGWSAGWIALESGLAGGADIILIPEIPYSTEKVAEYIKQKMPSEKHSIIIVIAEGAPEKHRQMDDKSAGTKLAYDLKSFGIETRASILGYIQRGGEPVAYDKILGARLGEKAVDLATNGEKNKFVSVNADEITILSLEKASSDTKFVPSNHPLVLTARGLGIYFGDD